MNHQPPKYLTQTSSLKVLAIGASALAVVICSASAAITFDLRVSSVAPSVGSLNGTKNVVMTPGGSGAVTLQIWAEVTSAAPSANPYGIQTIIGSVISTSAGGGVTGTLSVATPSTPFADSAPQGGVAGELSAVADTLGDLGSNSTSASTNMIKLSKASASGGQQVGTVFFATDTTPFGSTLQPVTNVQGSGFAFLMGTITLTISNYTTGASTLNWVIPGFTTPALRGTRAQWTDGDNIVNNGNTNLAEMFVGNAVTFAVPEPSAFGMVMLGALSMVGFRRFGMRRVS